MSKIKIEWTECDMTLAAFHTSHWAVGIVYEAREARYHYNTVRRENERVDDVNAQYLIGDVNDSGGMCNCCGIRAESDEETRVVRYARLI